MLILIAYLTTINQLSVNAVVNNFCNDKQFIVTLVSLVITVVGALHFQDLIADVVSSVSGNSLHFEHDTHWTQNGIIISETYTLMLASL